MCYLIAKDRESHGCLAFKTTHGKHLVELKRKLNRAVGYKEYNLLRLADQQLMENTLRINLLIQNRNLKKALKRCVHRILLVNCKKAIHLVTIFKIQSRRALQPAGIFAL